jgi:AcrR family transcriptional regulator
MQVMSPRPYRLQQRRETVDATSQRIVEAARRVLVAGDQFSIDAAAREAGVARVTVYDHFGTREALLEAVFDDLAESGGLSRLPEAFTQADATQALERFVLLFCDFYSVHRVVLRRLQALAVLGRSADVISGREERRLLGLQTLLARLATDGHAGADTVDIVRITHALTSFAFVDELAGDDDIERVAPQVVSLVRGAAGLR